MCVIMLLLDVRKPGIQTFDHGHPICLSWLWVHFCSWQELVQLHMSLPLFPMMASLPRHVLMSKRASFSKQVHLKPVFVALLGELEPIGYVRILSGTILTAIDCMYDSDPLRL
jgi:hypothetical protein